MEMEMEMEMALRSAPGVPFESAWVSLRRFGRADFVDSGRHKKMVFVSSDFRFVVIVAPCGLGKTNMMKTFLESIASEPQFNVMVCGATHASCTSPPAYCNTV